jgi:hypothetical protein
MGTFLWFSTCNNEQTSSFKYQKWLPYHKSIKKTRIWITFQVVAKTTLCMQFAISHQSKSVQCFFGVLLIFKNSYKLHVFKINHWLLIFQNMIDNNKLHVFPHYGNLLCKCINPLIFCMLGVGICQKLIHFVLHSRACIHFLLPLCLLSPSNFGNNDLNFQLLFSQCRFYTSHDVACYFLWRYVHPKETWQTQISWKFFSTSNFLFFKWSWIGLEDVGLLMSMLVSKLGKTLKF